MRKALLVFLLISLTSYSQAGNDLRRIFKRADAFFKAVVTDGKVDYEKILNDPSEMEYLASRFAEADLSAANPKEKKAFYINAYNLLVIKSIVTYYPVRGPQEIEGFYSRINHIIAQEAVTLNQIMREKLLGSGADLLVVFALCQGTNGSFPLSGRAYTPSRLKRQLNRQVKQCANDLNYIRVKKNSSRLLVCEAFIYCLKLNNKMNFLSLLNQFRNEAVPENFILDFYPGRQELNIVSERF